MRIAYLVPSLGLQEGQGTADLELLRRIARAGHRVDVFTSSAPDVVRTLAGITVRPVPRLPAWQLGNQLLSLATTSATLRAARYDLVHADAGVTLRRSDVIAVHTVSARWLELPHAIWRESGLRGRHADAATRFKARLEVAQARAARAVVANSPMTADDLVARGVDRDRITVLPFGVDAERFRPPDDAERAQARASFGIDDDRFVWCFVGAHGPRKGLPLALDVLEEHRDGTHMIVAGEHRGGAWARDAQRRDLPVSMPGKLPDVRRAYWAADAFVFPSRYDAFGMAVLEAMACALPVVVSDAAGARDIARDAGFVLDPTDREAWAEALAALRTDPGRRAALGRRAREIALARDWDEAGRILLDLYERGPG